MTISFNGILDIIRQVSFFDKSDDYNCDDFDKSDDCDCDDCDDYRASLTRV